MTGARHRGIRMFCLILVAALAVAQETRPAILQLPHGAVTRLVSPDGTRVLYGVPYQGGINDQPQLWIENLRTNQRKMVLAIRSTLSAIWSPDGSAFSVQ